MSPHGAGSSLSARPVFFLYGDSITQLGSRVDTGGWVARLQEEYTDSRTGDILNRGFSGYNTRWALLQLPHLIQQTPTPPALATVFFGANDAAVPESRQHVPLEEFESNLEDILALLRTHWPACQMIVITPPPMDQQVWDTERGGAGMRTLERTRQYAAAALAVAARAKCGSIDLFTRIISTESWKDCLCDGLHLSSRGNAELFAAIRSSIDERAPHLRPAASRTHFPLWSDMAEAFEKPEALIPRLVSEAANAKTDDVTDSQVAGGKRKKGSDVPEK